MKMIKTDRCTQKEEALSNCLTIKLEDSSVQDFDPLPAIDVWFNRAHCRPGTSKSKGNKLDATAAAMVLEDVEEMGDSEKVVENQHMIQITIHLNMSLLSNLMIQTMVLNVTAQMKMTIRMTMKSLIDSSF